MKNIIKIITISLLTFSCRTQEEREIDIKIKRLGYLERLIEVHDLTEIRRDILELDSLIEVERKELIGYE